MLTECAVTMSRSVSPVPVTAKEEQPWVINCRQLCAVAVIQKDSATSHVNEFQASPLVNV